MSRIWTSAALCGGLMACASEPTAATEHAALVTTDPALAAAIDAFERETNALAKARCGDSDEQIARDDASPCYYELAAEYDRCEREAMHADPAIGRAILACEKRDRDALLACCTIDDACTYDRIEPCYERLWGGKHGGACDVDVAALERAVDACEKESAVPCEREPVVSSGPARTP